MLQLYSRLTRVSLIVLGAVFFYGCASTNSGPRAMTEFEQLRPTSILVVPVVNKSVDVEAPTYMLTTLPMVLGNRGYYVFPINTVKTILDHEGFYEPAEVHAQPPESLAAMFGADCILYVTIHEWTSQYILLATTTIVDFEYRLVNSDGHQFWHARKKLHYSPQNNDTGNPLANLVGAAISAALERAKPNYLPLTRQANGEVFLYNGTAIPPGPYSPKHQAYYSQFDVAPATDKTTEEQKTAPAAQ
ncbi:DUF799 domain-containing protein [Saccharophagus degradans]|uniref:DUF799 family lipoprotein n=1 Tax=Saccharophagus degradans TaxID=86304 RepID=A0AAW7XAM8_9GAMM|nr:GNA1162 family protein [Saccharophagus degradans]MDO6423818.1 DUF799 family lipoprotein [Saccharophagus degradans]MDO6607898.1 DUF799 family lipoprotein [Saccharophagus degradans]